MGLDKGKLSRAETGEENNTQTTRCLAEPIEHAMLQDLSYMFDQMTRFFHLANPRKYIDKSGKADLLETRWSWRNLRILPVFICISF